jgi:VanZ family protein
MIALTQRLFAPQLLRPLFWLLFAFALVMAVLPKPPQTPIDSLGDKFAHMLAFAVLTGVAALAWRKTSRWAIMLRLALFGAAIEVVQAVPKLHRTSDLRDWVADCAAIALAMLIAQLLIRILPLDETT